MVVTEEVARGGHGGGGPWGVAEDVARTGHGGGGPWGVTEEAVRGGSRRRRPRTGHGGGPCRSWGRRSVQVAEEVVRAGGGGDLIQKFRILQVFLVFSLMKI